MALSISIPKPSGLSTSSSEESHTPMTPDSPKANCHALPTKSVDDNTHSPTGSSSTASPVSILIADNGLTEANLSAEDVSDPSSAIDSGKRKTTSRRANTAERRATHNAVERQRRETLNGRFLELARLLPNLSQIRRPSKSSIVNSSLAFIHASQRHRILASRVCSALAAESDSMLSECDALRRELNEWRDRAGLPRIRARTGEREKNRGEAYRVIIGGELDVVMAVGGEDGGDDDDAENKFGGYSIGGDTDVNMEPFQDVHDHGRLSDEAMAGIFAHTVSPTVVRSNARPHPQSSHPHSCSSHPHQRSHHHRHSSRHGHRADSVSIAMPSSTVSFENPAMALNINTSMAGIFDPNSLLDGVSPVQSDKYSGLYGNGAHTLFTPPTSSHGLETDRQRTGVPVRIKNTPPLSASAASATGLNPKTNIFAHAQALQVLQTQSRSYKARSPENDIGSPAGSASGASMGRARSSSTTGSGYESSPWSPINHDERYDTAAIPNSPNDYTSNGFEMTM